MVITVEIIVHKPRNLTKKYGIELIRHLFYYFIFNSIFEYEKFNPTLLILNFLILFFIVKKQDFHCKHVFEGNIIHIKFIVKFRLLMVEHSMVDRLVVVSVYITPTLSVGTLRNFLVNILQFICFEMSPKYRQPFGFDFYFYVSSYSNKVTIETIE